MPEIRDRLARLGPEEAQLRIPFETPAVDIGRGKQARFIVRDQQFGMDVDEAGAEGGAPGLLEFFFVGLDVFMLGEREQANPLRPRLFEKPPERPRLEVLAMTMGARKSVVSGKRVSVSVDIGGRRIIKKKNTR